MAHNKANGYKRELKKGLKRPLQLFRISKHLMLLKLLAIGIFHAKL